MEERRIRKTKQSIKDMLIQLLRSKPFDEITVTELCLAADISRITFYSHYTDKYDLVEEMCGELLQIVREQFDCLQRENNPKNDTVIGHCNFLDCILSLCESHSAFLRQMSQRRNPYLYYSFYNHVFRQVDLRLESKRISAFLCNGLWAYIDACYDENEDIETIRKEAQCLLKQFLKSNLNYYD